MVALCRSGILTRLEFGHGDLGFVDDDGIVSMAFWVSILREQIHISTNLGHCRE